MAFPSLKEQTYSKHNALSLQCWAGCLWGRAWRTSNAYQLWRYSPRRNGCGLWWWRLWWRWFHERRNSGGLEMIMMQDLHLNNMQFTDLPINFAWHVQFWVEHQLSSTAGHVFTDPDGPKVQALKAFGTIGTTDCGSWGDGKMIDGVDHT